MKKIVLALLCICVVFSCVGCGNSSKSKNEDAGQTQESETTSITDNDIEDIAMSEIAKVLSIGGYGERDLYEKFVSPVKASNCKYEVNKIEGDESQGWHVYGRLSVYDDYGNVIEYCGGGGYEYNFEVSVGANLSAKCLGLYSSNRYR